MTARGKMQRRISPMSREICATAAVAAAGREAPARPRTWRADGLGWVALGAVGLLALVMVGSAASNLNRRVCELEEYQARCVTAEELRDAVREAGAARRRCPEGPDPDRGQ